METLTSRDVCEQLFDKISSFVLTAFDYSPNEFRALYRNSVNDFSGGFRRIELVPKNLLVRRISKDCITNPAVALAILKNWYQAKRDLHSVSITMLQQRGYQIVEPDFEKDSIAHQALAPKDIQVEEGASYFSAGNEASGFDKLELTVMIALLGWFPNFEQTS